MIHDPTNDYLPGEVRVTGATASEYRALERFHYLPKRPATWARVWAAWFDTPRTSRLIGVVVLSYPSSTHACRNRVFRLRGLSQRAKLRWANEHLRTISRVIVHPQFRSVGIARALVERAIMECPTRYVESSARMGRAHPLFERCGMTRVDPPDPSKPLYYWFDRLTYS
jgi:ABC-type ATPase with predicted acetyltransferase domain